MDKSGKLRLALLDVYGNFLGEKVDVILRHQTLNETVKVSVSATKKIDVINLRGAPQGLYRIEIDPPSYLAVNRFVNLKASGFTDMTVNLPIDFKKVKKIKFPNYPDLAGDLQNLLENSLKVFSFEGKKGRTLYNALDDTRRAGLLNIAAKAQATPLSNGQTVLPFIKEVSEIRGDRFFAVVPKQLREETKNSVAEGLFRSVSGSLHHPPPGFTHAGSFKTHDHYGNLQLTFFMKDQTCVADIDIDDAAGLEHIFQVVRNLLPGQSTHPLSIHQILIFHQKLNPGYLLLT